MADRKGGMREGLLTNLVSMALILSWRATRVSIFFPWHGVQLFTLTDDVSYGEEPEGAATCRTAGTVNLCASLHSDE